ncbi:MAG: hypothetical protein ABID54_11235 [Pseudomonadota bacterium]
MKKLFVSVSLVMFLSGCGTLGQKSEFWKHDSVYKSIDHLWFSWCGWRTPDEKDSQKSEGEQWWGIEVHMGQPQK